MFSAPGAERARADIVGPYRGQVRALTSLIEVTGGPRICARGSATESAALLDVCCRLKLLEESGHRTGKAMIVRIVSMLIKLAQSCED